MAHPMLAFFRHMPQYPFNKMPRLQWQRFGPLIAVVLVLNGGITIVGIDDPLIGFGAPFEIA